MKHALAALLCLTLIACTGARKSVTTATAPDGTITVKEATTYAQLGGRGGLTDNAPGGLTVWSENEKSFRDFALAAASISYSMTSAAVAKAKEVAATRRAATAARATTEQARIAATERAAVQIGSNPEANAGAIEAVGTALR